MRVIIIFIITILACSCHQADSNLKSYSNIEKRYDEIFKIVADYSISEFEKNHLPGETYIGYDRSNYKLRGPLTKKQVEQELIARFNNPKNIPNIPLLNKYQKGDEFYYYEYNYIMNGIKGYMLIRDNQFLGELETERRM